jgi:hypothetical protein
MTAVLSRKWTLSLLWALSLDVVAVVSSRAQQPQRPREQFNPPLELPTIISGNDVGFRVERMQGELPIGSVVVRINGRWVDTNPPRLVPGR